MKIERNIGSHYQRQHFTLFQDYRYHAKHRSRIKMREFVPSIDWKLYPSAQVFSRCFSLPQSWGNFKCDFVDEFSINSERAGV